MNALDPRIEYQKQIDQVNRFHSILFLGGFSIILKALIDYDYILSFEIEYATLFLSAMLLFIASAWDKKIHLLLSQKKAVEKVMLQESSKFEWLIQMETKEIKKYKPLSQKLNWPEVDIPLPRIMLMISILFGVFSFVSIITPLIKWVLE